MENRRLFISADIEGVAGVVSPNETTPEGADYEMARRWMTEEIVAACDAARKAGIEEVIVADSHGLGTNILIDALPDFVEIVRSWPRELMMVQGIETGPFIGAAFLGYHAGSRADSGVLAHTMSSRDVMELRLNGRVMSELLFNAVVTGHFDVPVIMVSGDDVCTEHAGEVLPGIEVATVKWSHGYISARSVNPAESCRRIASAITRAIGDVDRFEPLRMEKPIVMEIMSLSRFKTEILSYMPGAERVDSHTIRIEVPDMVYASRFLNVYLRIDASL